MRRSRGTDASSDRRPRPGTRGLQAHWRLSPLLSTTKPPTDPPSRYESHQRSEHGREIPNVDLSRVDNWRSAVLSASRSHAGRSARITPKNKAVQRVPRWACGVEHESFIRLAHCQHYGRQTRVQIGKVRDDYACPCVTKEFCTPTFSDTDEAPLKSPCYPNVPDPIPD